MQPIDHFYGSTIAIVFNIQVNPRSAAESETKQKALDLDRRGRAQENVGKTLMCGFYGFNDSINIVQRVATCEFVTYSGISI